METSYLKSTDVTLHSARLVALASPVLTFSVMYSIDSRITSHTSATKPVVYGSRVTISSANSSSLNSSVEPSRRDCKRFLSSANSLA